MEIKCPTCKSSKTLPLGCKKCGGRGFFLHYPQVDLKPAPELKQTCSECNGSGRSNLRYCSQCESIFKITETR